MTKCIVRLFIIRLNSYIDILIYILIYIYISMVLFFSEFFVFIVIRNKMLLYMYGLDGNGSCVYFVLVHTRS